MRVRVGLSFIHPNTMKAASWTALLALLGCLSRSSAFAVQQRLRSSPLLLRPSSSFHASPSSSSSSSASLARRSRHTVPTAEAEGGGFKLPPMLDPGTKGGAVVVTGGTVMIPIVAYNVFKLQGMDEMSAGNLASGSFVVIAILAWTSTYLFRVGNKEMTYAKQLKSYEDAVIAKRLEELADEEVEALLDEIDRD